MRDGFHYIRAAARRVLDEYQARTDGPCFTAERSAASQLEAIAASVIGLAVTRDYLLPEDTYGRLDLKAKVIGYAPDLGPAARNFTVAHEIGHRALKHPDGPFLEGPGDVDDAPDHAALGVQNGVYRSYSGRSRYELEANVFAAELLAPIALVRKTMRADPSWKVEPLAAYFGLSRTAMLNQIATAMLPLPDESEVLPSMDMDAAPIEDSSHERAIAVDSPACVQAGPGSGKTRVLAGRYIRLVREGDDPRRILALTFANKAAAEMRERIARALPEVPADQIAVTTFHSFGLDLIRRYRKALGYEKEPKLLSPADILALLRPELATMPLGRFESVSAPATRLGLLLDAVSRAKDELIAPDEYAEIALRWEGEVARRPAPANAQEAEKAESSKEHAAKCRQAAEFYAAYEDLLRRHEAVDYGDLIRLSVALAEGSGARAEIQAEFDHILVDEFQDVNHASGRLVQALDGGRGIVWAVGDVRQGIYGFRGASSANMLRFEERFSDAKLLSLGRNYRSVEDVVACGSAVPVVDPFTGETLPHLQVEAHRGRSMSGSAVTLVEEAHPDLEMAYIVGVVAEERASGRAEGDIAVLCRTRADAQRISDGLEAAGTATSWMGDPMASTAFKDVLAVVALAAGDPRGLERAGTLSEHLIPKDDVKRLLAWRKEHRGGVASLLSAARDGSVDGIDGATRDSCGVLLNIVGTLAAHGTAYVGIADYLFARSDWCRRLIGDDSPKARRALASVRQVLSLARAQAGAPREDGDSAIRAFVKFVDMAHESGRLETISPELGDSRLVNVMTVHASKGLEWPVVVVPFLNDDKFPMVRSGERVPVPGRFARDGEPVDDKLEEACLFFVAVTRARDRLVLTRAQGDRRKRSRYLDPLIERLSGTGFLLHREERVQARPKAVDVDVIPEPERVFEYSDLAAYSECPKKYEYERVLSLEGGDRGYSRYHRSISLAVERLHELQAMGETIEDEAVLRELDAIWMAKGPIGHYYERRLRTLAERVIIDYARRRAEGTVAEAAKDVIVDAGGRLVRVRVDEFEPGPPAVFRRIHLTGPSKSHLGKDEDDRHALFAMYAAQTFGPGWTIEAYYPAMGEARASLVATGSEGRLIAARKKKMLKLSAGLLSGTYSPTGDERTCQRCAFAIVCPKGAADAPEPED